MEGKIDISVEIDPSCKEPKVIIKTAEINELVEKIKGAAEACAEDQYPRITAYRSGSALLLDQRSIIRIYTENRHLVICTQSGKHESRQTLKELEDALDSESFVRISRFEIVNLRKVSGFDLSIAGTIKVNFEDGTETYVARRYVRSILQKMNLSRSGGGDIRE